MIFHSYVTVYQRVLQTTHHLIIQNGKSKVQSCRKDTRKNPIVSVNALQMWKFCNVRMLGSGFPTLELKHPSESSQLTIVIIALSENQEAEMSLVKGSSLKCQRGSQTIGQWEILTWKSFNPGPR